MENHMVCQSCGMPLDNLEMQGKEKDNTLNQDYCRHCYQNGAFVHPGISLSEMTERVTRKMEKMEIPVDIIEAVVIRLPNLKRWKGA